MSNETVLREKLATCSRIMAMQEMLGCFGHISVYDPTVGRVYMSPGMGADKACVRPDDVLATDIEGKILEGDHRLPAEWPIHTVLHGTRSDALAIAHLHAPYSTLFSITKREFRPVTLQGSIFSDGVPLYTEPRLVRDVEDGKRLAGVIGDGMAAFMRGHGIVVVARDVEEMLYCAMVLEDEATKAAQVAPLGEFHCLTHHECNAFHGKQALPDRSKRAWGYYAQLEKRWDKQPGTGRVPFV
jgi:ribulose-5-phosphate 4-epimerase/fuculose-1-phosphate aldolase